MPELNHRNLDSRHKFFVHMARNALIGFALIFLALCIGMWGYMYFEQMSLADAFVSAAMILSGMGPISPLTTATGKVFAGFYALFSGLVFILIVGIIFAPIAHRFFKKIHLEDAVR